jgi:preprotein translocase subunit YajC
MEYLVPALMVLVIVVYFLVIRPVIKTAEEALYKTDNLRDGEPS